MSLDPTFKPTTERAWRELPDILRDTDAEQVFPIEIKEVVEAFNYIINSSAELSSPGSEVGRNYFPDPSFEYDQQTTIPLVNNLVLNPSGKLLDGRVTVRKNLTYPSNIGGEINTVIVPNSHWNTSSDWWRVESFAPGRGAMVRADIEDLIGEVTYTASVEVGNPNNTDITINMRWANGEPTVKVIKPGASAVVSGTGAEVIYFEDKRGGYVHCVEGLPFVMRRPLVEAAGTFLPYFTGAAGTGDADLTPEWAGTPGDSPSMLTAPKPKGWEGENGVVYWSTSKSKVLLFVAYVGEATAKAQASIAPEDRHMPVNHIPVTSMIRINSKDKMWRANYDGAWPRTAFAELTESEHRSLQYPVLTGTNNPDADYRPVGAFWRDDNGTVYRRIK